MAAVQRLDAGTIKVNGEFIQMLGVNPSRFRAFAARPTARSTALWRSVAAGDIAVSYTMGREDRLKLGSKVHVAGAQPEDLRVGGFGTVGISGVDAVVSDTVATSLGIPSDNAVVVSAPHARLARLMRKIKRMLPRHAAIAQLVTQLEPGQVVQSQVTTGGAAGATSPSAGTGPPMTTAQVHAFLKAALSRVGLPYVWGAAGPTVLRLLRPGPVVHAPGRHHHAAGRGGPGHHRPAGPDQRPAAPATCSSTTPTRPRPPTSRTWPSTSATASWSRPPSRAWTCEVVRAVFGAGFAGAVQVSPAAAGRGNPRLTAAGLWAQPLSAWRATSPQQRRNDHDVRSSDQAHWRGWRR